MRRSVVAGPLPLSRNRVRKRAEEASTFKGKLSRTKVRRNLMEKERKKRRKLQPEMLRFESGCYFKRKRICIEWFGYSSWISFVTNGTFSPLFSPFVSDFFLQTTKRISKNLEFSTWPIVHAIISFMHPLSCIEHCGNIVDNGCLRNLIFFRA